MCNSYDRRQIIFVSDFALDFSVPIEIVQILMQDIVTYVESRGHLITFFYPVRTRLQ